MTRNPCTNRPEFDTPVWPTLIVKFGPPVYRHSTSSWSAFKLRPAKIQPAKPITKETTRQTKTNHNQTKTNHQNQPPALPPRGLGRCPISKTVPLPYAVSRPIDLR